MGNSLQDFKSENAEKSLSIVNKLYDKNFLQKEYLRESMQEQLEMHLNIAHELEAMRQKEINELKEFVARKTARIKVIEDDLARLSSSSLNLGKIRDSFVSGSIEDDK